MSRTLLSSCAVALTAVIFCSRAEAEPVSFEATDNATIQPTGPRAGGNGKAFLNVEGTNNGAFAGYGVADFNFSTLDPPITGTVSAISNVTFELTQANAAFSLDGPFSIYYTAATTVDIQPGGTSPLIFQAGMSGSATVGTELQPLTLLGTGNYVVGASGQVDVVTLTLTGAPLTALINAVNNDTTYRLVITPDAATTAATYAGITHSTAAGPTLKFDATVSGGFAGADFDENTLVNGVDLNDHWKVNYPKETGATHSNGDADADQDVDGTDFLLWQQQLTLVGGAAAVPEPGALALSAVGLTAAPLFGRRRTRRCQRRA